MGALLIWRLLPFDEWAWPVPILAAAFNYGPVLAIASAEVMALYLLVTARFGVNLKNCSRARGSRGSRASCACTSRPTAR